MEDGSASSNAGPAIILGRMILLLMAAQNVLVRPEHLLFSYSLVFATSLFGIEKNTKRPLQMAGTEQEQKLL